MAPTYEPAARRSGESDEDYRVRLVSEITEMLMIRCPPVVTITTPFSHLMNPDFTTAPTTSVHQDPLRQEAKAQLDRIEAALGRLEEEITQIRAIAEIRAGSSRE